MTRLPIGLVLALASFAIVQTIVSAIVGLLPRRRAASSREEAADLLWRAVAPAALGAGAMLLAVLPAFLIFEPPDAHEESGYVLLACAAAGAWRLLAIAGRTARLWWTSRRLVGEWSRGATPLPPGRWRAPAVQIRCGWPVVASGGLLRPRIYVDRSVLSVCLPRELDAIAAHERAHLARHDNLRRLLVSACAGPSSTVARAWRSAAEWAADEQAVSSPEAAVELASALLKVGRLAAAPAFEHAILSTIDGGGRLEARIQCLLALDASRPPTHGRAAWWTRAPLGVLAIGGIVTAGAWLHTIHLLLETAVQRLP